MRLHPYLIGGPPIPPVDLRKALPNDHHLFNFATEPPVPRMIIWNEEEDYEYTCPELSFTRALTVQNEDKRELTIWDVLRKVYKWIPKGYRMSGQYINVTVL